MDEHVSRAAFVQDWLAAEVGGERTALELTRLLPRAQVFTSFLTPGMFSGAFDRLDVHTWPLQRIPGARDHFRQLLPLYPAYFGSMDLRRFEFVLSGSVAFAHAVKTAPSSMHVSYVYTPMRYAWDQDSYFAASSWSMLARSGARLLRAPLRRWDRRTATRPDVLVAISQAVRQRIRQTWNREAEVIYPPVDTDEVRLSTRSDGFLLVAARMLAYRRLDQAVEACSRTGRELVMVGDGPERKHLESIAGPNVRFLGPVDRSVLIDLFARCRAYLVPGIEDFGIAPVEAMAAGKPVIAFNEGGAAESVIDGRTGVLYGRQDWASLAEALDRFDGMAFDPMVVRERAGAFSARMFYSRWRALFERLGVDPSLYRRDDLPSDANSGATVSGGS